MIETGIHSHLTTNAAVSALVSTRVYPYALPQGATLPAVVYSKVSRTRVRSHSGPSGLDTSRFRFHCIASSYLGAHTLAEAVITALDDPSWVWGSTPVRSCLVDNELDLGFVEETGNYQVAVDATIQHEE